MEVFNYLGNRIEYTLERKRIKNCYISVRDSKVVVRVPKSISQEKINQLLQKRASWIQKNVKEQRKKKVLKQHQYLDGDKFQVLGEEKTLEIEYETVKEVKIFLENDKIKSIFPEKWKNQTKEILEKRMDDFYKELAQAEVDKAMRKVTHQVGLKPNHYKIKKLKSTWGNCSSTKNISLNQKLAMYSRQAIEYVCLHEVCHLKYMNHSKDFWNMVSRFMPDYKIAEKELKK